MRGKRRGRGVRGVRKEKGRGRKSDISCLSAAALCIFAMYPG